MNKASLYGVDNDEDLSFTISFTATKNGQPYTLDLLALDSENTNSQHAASAEYINFTTDGQPWAVLESYLGGGEWTGVGTQSLRALDTETNTYSNQGNTIHYSEGASSISFDINGGGRQGVALSIFLVCDTDNDGIANYLDLDSDNDGCSDAYEAGATTNETPNYQFTDVVGDADGLSPTVDPGGDGTPDYTATLAQVTDGVGSCPECVFASGMDSDQDGLDNTCDLDDDNDGILDSSECFNIPFGGTVSPYAEFLLMQNFWKYSPIHQRLY